MSGEESQFEYPPDKGDVQDCDHDADPGDEEADAAARDAMSSVTETDVVHSVLAHLDSKDLCNAAKVCRHWRKQANDSLLWKTLYLKEPGFRFPRRKTVSVVPGESEYVKLQDYDAEGEEDAEWGWRPNWKSAYQNRWIMRDSWKQNQPCLIHTPRLHKGAVSCVSIQESVAASGGWDRTVRIFDIFSGEERRVIRGHKDIITGTILWGDAVASYSQDGTVRITNWRSGGLMSVLGGHGAGVKEVRPDFSLFADEPFNPCPDPAKKTLPNIVVLSEDGKAKLWTTRHDSVDDIYRKSLIRPANVVGKMEEYEKPLTHKEGHTFRHQGGRVSHCSPVLPDVATAAGGEMKVWDCNTGASKVTLYPPAHSHSKQTVTALDLRGSTLMCGLWGGEVLMYDLRIGNSHQLSLEYAHHDAVTMAARWWREEHFCITASHDGKIKSWDLRSRPAQFLDSYVAASACLGLCGSGGVGESMIAAYLYSGQIVILHRQTLNSIYDIRDFDYPRDCSAGLCLRCAVDLSNSRVAIGTPNGTVGVWHLPPGPCLSEILYPTR